MKNNNINFKENLGGILLGLYFLISQIMAIYFWWEYAQEDSFLTTLLIDPFLAEFKGFLWIFFIW